MKYLVSCFLVLSFITACVAQNQEGVRPYHPAPRVELRHSFEPQQVHGYQPKVGPSTRANYHHRYEKHSNSHQHLSNNIERNQGRVHSKQHSNSHEVQVPGGLEHKHHTSRNAEHHNLHQQVNH